MNHPRSSSPAVARLVTVAGVALAALLAACGGGGGASTSADPAPGPGAAGAADTAASTPPPEVVQVAPAPAPVPAPAPAPAASQTCGLGDFAASALARINQYRAAGADCRSGGVYAPAAALVWNVHLTEAAAGHSLDMASKNYFSHTSADGRSLVDRIEAAGYDWSALGENIAAGYPSMNGVVDGWMQSDGHCSNLMNPNFREMGLACVVGTPTSTYRTYWTLDLGKPR